MPRLHYDYTDSVSLRTLIWILFMKFPSLETCPHIEALFCLIFKNSKSTLANGMLQLQDTYEKQYNDYIIKRKISRTIMSTNTNYYIL